MDYKDLYEIRRLLRDNFYFCYHKYTGDILNYKVNVNTIYNDKYLVNINYYGDFEIYIYRINKSTRYDNFDKLGEYISSISDGNVLKNYTVKQFLKLFCDVNIYDTDNVLCDDNVLKNINFETMCPYHLTFKRIFKYRYKDVINLKIFYKDGNDSFSVLEFRDCFYVVDFGTS